MRVIFVAYKKGVSKANRDYEFVELSNGIRSTTFSVGSDQVRDVFKSAEEGDEFDVVIKTNPFDTRYNNVVAEIH